jgi:O-antigen ligase
VKTNFFETDLKTVKSNLFLILLTAIVSTLFLPLIINSIFIVLLLFWSILNVKKISFQKLVLSDYTLFIFFIWLTLSFIWTINKEDTLIAIIRQASFFIFPLAFLISPKKHLNFVLKWFSYSVFFIAVIFILRAIIRFFLIKDINVFFFHGDYNNDLGLVPKELNAIYVGAFSCLAFIYFLIKEAKVKSDYLIGIILFIFILMLRVNAILFSTALIVGIYFSFYSKTSNRMRLRNLVIIISIVISALFYKSINNFFIHEFKTNTSKGIGHDVISGLPLQKHRVTIYEAWNNKVFNPTDFFPGTAFRVYQTRLFFEFIEENSIFWQGFGLNASYQKIEEKGISYNIFLGNKEHEGYQKKNFHNQYFQTFAELGFIGFLFFIFILYINTKNAFQSKDFMHIAFAILMLSLFLTESFLWRQRGVVFFTLFYCLFNRPISKI